MRKLPFIFVFAISETLLLGQGYVLFANKFGAAVDAPVIRHLDPVRDGPGPEWTAQLFLMNQTVLTPLYPSSTFRPVPIAAVFGIPRYWFAKTNEVPGVLPGETATFLVRAWKTSFRTFEAAAKLGYVGESAPVTITVGDVSTPALLAGLQGFEVGPFTVPQAKLSMLSPSSPLVLLVEENGSLVNTVEISSDLKSWSRYLSVFSKLPTFRVIDRAPVLLGDRNAFLRLRGGEVSGPSLADWQKQGVNRYRFVFERLCFCRSYLMKGTVEVQDGRIVDVTNIQGDGMPVANADITQFKTIEELFEIIQTDSDQADLLVTAYDPVSFYPRLIDIDYISNAADDEITYYASDFQRLE